MKTLVNKNNPQIRITAPEIEEITSLGYTNYEIAREGMFPLLFNPKEWTLVEEEPKHTEVWVEGRTIFEQEGEPIEGIKGNSDGIPSNVDLEKELDKFYGMYRKDGKTYGIKSNEKVSDWKENGNFLFKIELVRHFYELGLKAGKEE